VFWCLLVAGPSFGFAALKPVLVSEGVYKEYCTSKEIEHSVEICQQQELKLNMVFTIAAVMTNVTALIVGPILDSYGPKLCGIIGALLISLSCFTLRSAVTIHAFDGYIVGYTLLAVGGPFTFISSFQLSNTFPNHSGLILALLTGAFDASSAVFLFYRIAYEKSGGAFHIHDFFTIFLVVPVFILLAQIFIMPHESYVTMKELALESLDIHEAPSGESSYVTEETALLETAGNQSASGIPKYLDNCKDDGQISHCHVDDLEQNSGVWGVLHGLSILDQLKTPWFYIMVAFTTIQMLRINYFVATVLSQYTYLLGSFERAELLNNFFNVALPLGGLLAIPIIGVLLDTLSTFSVLTLMLVVSTCIGCIGLIPNSIIAGYFNISLLVVYRPFYYTSVSDYAAKVFGFDTFGRVYGLIISISGVFNLLQAFLDRATLVYFKGNPAPVNIFLLSSTVVFGVALLVYIRTQIKHIKRKQLELEAEQAPVLTMP
jgi:MFS family permease